LDEGIHVVAAAGNESTSAENSSPARMEKIITVAASDITDKLWDESNYGRPVDIIAPGVKITSCGQRNNTDTNVGSGTSMVSRLT